MINTEKIIGTVMQTFFSKKFASLELNDKGRVEVYSNFEKEYNSLRKGVALRNLSDNIFIELSGEEIPNFISRISTNEINSINKNKSVKTLFCNFGGGVIDEVLLLKRDEKYLMIRSCDEKTRVKRWLEKYLVDEKIEIELAKNKYLLFEILGRQKEAYMRMLGDEKVDELKLYETKKFFTEGFQYSIIKLESKFWLLAQVIDEVEFVKFLLDNKSILDFSFVGDKAYEAFRMEEKISALNSEFTGDFTPYQLSLEDLIDKEKKEFIGYRNISESQKQKYFAVIDISDIEITELPFRLEDAKRNIIAIITSKTYSPKYKKEIALALIEPELFPEKKIIKK